MRSELEWTGGNEVRRATHSSVELTRAQRQGCVTARLCAMSLKRYASCLRWIERIRGVSAFVIGSSDTASDLLVEGLRAFAANGCAVVVATYLPPWPAGRPLFRRADLTGYWIVKKR